MLNPLDDRWSAGFLGDVHEPLDPQQPRTKILRDAIEQELQFVTRQRSRARQHEAFDRLVLKVIERQVMMVAVASMAVFVMMVVFVIVAPRGIVGLFQGQRK